MNFSYKVLSHKEHKVHKVLSNMENLNAVMIEDGVPQPERLKRLNDIAIHQMRVLSADPTERKLLK